MHEFCYEKIDLVTLVSTWTLKLSDFPHQSEKIILRRNLARVCLEKMHKLNF